MNSIVRNIASSQEKLTIETKSTLQRHKAEIGRFEKTISAKAPKDQIEKISETLEDTRTAFDAQFNYQKSELKNALDTVDKFRRTVTNLQSDMKLRDDALKKVPSNTAQILKALKKQMEDTIKRCDDVDVSFDRKLDKDDYRRTMKTKLDAEVFLKVFPAHIPPIEILKGMI